jgi:cell division protein FtsN
VTQGKTLSRDYKHVKRHTPGGPGFSGMTGFTVGLAAGLAVALGVFLHYRDRPAPEPQAASGKPPASAQATEAAPPAPVVDPARDYTFYDDLPRQEVAVPQATDKSNGKAAPNLPAGDVVLQAGSFKQPAEADKLQAKLAQYGVDSKIQRFALEDETWYRVRIGPIATVEQLETIRAKLAEAEIEATPVTAQAIEPPP